MKFLVEYADCDKVWGRDSADIADTIQFEDLVRKSSPLFLLRFKMDIAAKEKARLKGSQIVGVAPGVHVYVEVRGWDNNGEW
jgi:hypothetical protein